MIYVRMRTHALVIVGVILTSFLIAAPPVDSANSDALISNIGTLRYDEPPRVPPLEDVIHAFWFDAGFAHMSNWWTGNDLTQGTYDRLNFAKSMSFDTFMLTFHRQDFEEPLWSGNIDPNAITAFNKLISEAHSRGLKVIFGKDWKHDRMVFDPNYEYYVPDSLATTEKGKMQTLCRLWRNIALQWKDDPKVFAFGMPLGDNGAVPPPWTGIPKDRSFDWYKSKEACKWWAPLLQIWLDTMWDVDESLTLLAPMMTTMANAETLKKDYWTPELLNIRGPIIWEKDTAMRYDEVLNPTQHYPYRANDVVTLDWMKRWNQNVISECLHGFVGGYGPIGESSVWEWNTQTLEWLEDWLRQRESDGFGWWWESYGWKVGTLSTGTPSEHVRTYLTSSGTERPFVDIIRQHLRGLNN